jgi:hypothetical protein
VLWELINIGHLAHWWEYVVFVGGWLVVLVGLVAIAVIIKTRPPARPE